MNTVAKVGIGVGAVALAVAIFPALKGPYYRAKNYVNEKLDNEFVVDNYKAEYVNLHEKRLDVVENIKKFNVEKKVTEKKLEYAVQKTDVAKKNVISVGTSDMRAFNRAKDEYESLKVEVSNYETMLQAYNNALDKLENTLYLIDTNMSKAKANVTTLESKKTLVDSIKAVNKTVESINGVGSTKLGISVEKLDDDVVRESIKLEALRETCSPTTDKKSAEEYLKSLQD